MDLRFSKAVKSVIVLEKSPSGDVIPSVLHKKKKNRKKKGTQLLRPVEKLARKMAQASSAFAEEYKNEHNKSNQKARDGWLIDLGKNTFVAARKAGKSIK